MLQNSGEVDDETKSKLRDTYHNVTELGANRAAQLSQSLRVRRNYLTVICKVAKLFTIRAFVF